MNRLFFLILFFLVCFPTLGMADAGYGTHLTCLKTCDSQFYVSDGKYGNETTCTKCCDNTFGKKYTDCNWVYKKCKKGCLWNNKHRNAGLDCNAYCASSKADCVQENSVSKAFSCPGNWLKHPFFISPISMLNGTQAGRLTGRINAEKYANTNSHHHTYNNGVIGNGKSPWGIVGNKKSLPEG